MRAALFDPWGQRPWLLSIFPLCVGIACATTNDEEILVHEEPQPDAGKDASRLGDAFFPIDDAAEEDAGCTFSCSDDLHDILNCDGSLRAKCPDDKACGGNGECVAPCDGAAADKSSYGCDFYVADPAELADDATREGSCFAMFVANMWTTDATIGLEYKGESIDIARYAYLPNGSGPSLTYTPLPDAKLPPGKVAVVFLASYSLYPDFALGMCPSSVNVAIADTNVKLKGTGRANAFHFTSDRPVVAYDIYPFGGEATAIPSATLLLPTTAWDTNYIAQAGYPKAGFEDSMGQPFIQVVAKEDDTKVTIDPAVRLLPGMGVPPTPSGRPHTYVVDKGEILQFVQDEELTGSAIQSDKPVGMWGGNTCMNVEITHPYCDTAHQQIPPLKALGNDYAAVRYRDRVEGDEEVVPWRVVGVVDGTTLTYDPEPPADAPTTLHAGDIYKFRTKRAFSVRSQDAKHPFYMSGHMTGGLEHADIGDAEWVNVIPTDQYMTKYVFFTDPTYPNTHLVLVRRREGGELKDVKLGCAGTLTGWKPVGSGGRYESLNLDLVRDGVAQGACDNGVHTIESEAPFSLTVWGWGTDASYAYPGGTRLRTINPVVVVPK